MVPSWVPVLNDDTPVEPDDDAGVDPPDESEPDAVPDHPTLVRIAVPLAPAARFAATRGRLGEFASTGDRGAMRRSLGRYIRTGYGGAETATRRFGGTAATARDLGAALANMASRQPALTGSRIDPTLLAGRSAQDVMDAVVDAVRPVDGTQDAEAARAGIRDALSDLLTRFPEADLLNLEPQQRSFAIETYTAIDVFRRFELDIGKTIVERAPSAVTALSRLKDVKD